MEIKHAIRILRKQKGWTQQQLADFAHTSKSNISNLENGNQGYSPAILKYLAKALDCSVSQIFLLAENLDEQGNPRSDMPQASADALLMQLPKEIQNRMLDLLRQMVREYHP